MNNISIDTIGGVIFAIMGLCFSKWHKRLGQWTSDFYFKLLNIRFSIKGYQIGFLIGGIIFSIFGLLLIFQII